MSILDEDFNMTVGSGHSVVLVEKLVKMLCYKIFPGLLRNAREITLAEGENWFEVIISHEQPSVLPV